MAVYFTLLKPGDTVLGMNLAHGGHLTHGHPLNFSGKFYTIVPYGVRQDDERIDYDEFDRLAREHKPKMIIVGASAYPRVIDFERIGRIGREIGTPVVTDMAHIAGLVAAKVHPSPVPHSDFVTTTTHKTLRGPRGGMVLCAGAVREGPRPLGLPRHPGRAADAHHRRQGRVPEGSDGAGVRRLSAADRRQRHAARDRRSPPPASGSCPGGTDNHLMLVDVFSKGLTGKVAEAALGQAPGSPSTRTRSRSTRIRRWSQAASASARQPSRAAGCAKAGNGHDRGAHRPALWRRPKTTAVLAMVRAEVEALCRKFPLYPEP